MRLVRKIVAVLQTVLQVWVPVCLLSWAAARPLPAYADNFLDKAAQGQALGRSIVPNASSLANQDESGNINLHYQGKTSTVAPSALFSDEKNTSDPNAAAAAGNNAEVIDDAHAATSNMATSPSMTGEAYRTMTDSEIRARVDMNSDPMWKSADDAITRALSGVDSKCEMVTGTSTATTTAHVPDYQVCERIAYPTGGTCNFYHDYTVEFLGSLSVGAWGTSTGSITITVNAQTGVITSCQNCSSNGLEVWAAPPAGICTAPSEGINQTVSHFAGYVGATLTQVPTCDNGFTAVLTISNHGENPEQLHTGTLTVDYYHIVDHGWTSDPGCEVFLTNVPGDSILKPADPPPATDSYTCSEGPCETATEISGTWVDQSVLPSTNPFASVGISNLATEVTIALADFNQGALNCYTDPTGAVHCPENTGGLNDTCTTLESNPACSYVSQQCIEGAKDPTDNNCYAWDVVYDCGTNVGITDVTTTTGYSCDGVIRCMGEECVNGEFDPNSTGFAKATALLNMTQYAAGDMDCTSSAAGDGCTIWTGQMYQCKKALGGYVNCCQKPEGVSLVSYISLLTNSFALTSANWDLNNILPGPLASNPLNGSWADLSGYTSDVTGFLKDTFTSAWDGLVGSSAEATTGTGAGAFGSGLSQALMAKAYNLINGISPDLADAIFGGGTLPGEIAFSEGMMTLMSVVTFISWIYTIYQVLDILIHIIWACEQEELELGAKEQLKVCHYVGSYCDETPLGICIEKQERYCCYNSPLARIMQEQIRKQGIDFGWGSGKHPRCEGLSVSELNEVNWNEVDLSEWLALLTIGGVYPTQKGTSLDALTGSGSQFNFNSTSTSTPRPDAAQRVQDKINASGQDLEKLRQQGDLKLWGEGGTTIK